MAGVIGDIFSLNDVYERQTLTVDSAVVEVQAMTGLTVTATSGTGSVATLTFAAQTVAPFPVGSVIAVSGVVPLGYTGTYRVTACTTTTVSYDNTTTGALTTGGTVLLVTEKIIQSNFWSDLRSHGWFGSGAAAPVYSTVDRIDFSNDSVIASIRGPLTAIKYRLGSVGNDSYGWFGGGSAPGSTSTVDRVDFSNDSSTASSRGPLSLARFGNNIGTSNLNYGWFGGGYTPGTPTGTLYSRVDRIDFSNDSATASVRGSLLTPKSAHGSVGNSNYGWFGAGAISPIPSLTSSVDRIDFSNDSPSATARASLSSIKSNLAATGNSNYGWFGGGALQGPVVLTTIERIDFSNDSATASVRGPLNLSSFRVSATGNSNYGWFSAATTFPISARSTIERIDFSNDSTTASFRGPLSAARYLSTATSGQAKSSSIRKPKTLGYGWFGGGSGPVSTVDRIDFSNDSATASVRGPLSAVRYQLAATGNSNYGWFGGGRAGSPVVRVATVERIDFSNDSSTASVRGPLSVARDLLTATGNSNYGWFGGGYAPSLNPKTTATVDRIDFSNDSATASTKGSLSAARYSFGSTGNSNYGWFGGGYTLGSGRRNTVDRIDFSNDSSTASVRGPLSVARDSLAATGNSNYGWFTGGNTIPGPLSTVDRIDFSNDSVQTSVRGPITPASGTGIYGATGNSNYGWFGGASITPTATINRIDFSNDSATASVRGPLSAGRFWLAATSNSTR